MNDFASGLMVRLLQAGQPAQAAGAHVPLADKRALIAALVARRGRAALLAVGMGIDHLAGTPVHQALRGAATPHDFVQRWQRLERYLHSRHRIAITASGPHSLELLHHAPGHAHGPSPEESLLVLGVLVAGMQACGASALHVHSGALPLYPHTGAQVAAAPALSGGIL